MAKEKQVTRVIKLQIEAGKANPAPPVGPALGQAQVNIQEFCQRFNDASKEMMGNVVPVVITVYDDRSYTFVLKTPPASNLLKKAAGIKSAGKKGNKEIVATVTSAQVRAIAEQKMPDLSANDVEAGMKIIAGTARNMGIAIED